MTSIPRPEDAVEPTDATIAAHQPHLPWCDPDCHDISEDDDWPQHYGRRHLVDLDGGGLTEGLRNDPRHRILAVRAAELGPHAPMIDIEVDTATSGRVDLMWLTPAEARRYALAILTAVAEAESGAR